jgi:DNA-directed RNA polymerase subunit RPC12/RpoP
MIPSDPSALFENPMSPKPPDPTLPPPAATGALAAQQAGTVKIQKREVKEPSQLREKVCATCGRTFELTPDQKYFNCPHCYRKTLPVKKPARKSEAQILTQITCMECGTVEYLDFVPPDVHSTYCHSCFAKKRQELQASRSHPESR